MICLAAANGHLEAMNILIDNNADINVQVKRYSMYTCTSE